MKVIDLFCGCGGMSLGFQNAGYNIIAAYDNWKPAIETYKKNFNHPIFERDLSDSKIIEELKKYNADIIIGGPPCQDFSSAGYRNENGQRASLTKNYTNIVTTLKPNFFVMENVARINVTQTYKNIKQLFHEAGYGLTECILDACYYGVPQKRKRLFLIGCLHGEDNFLIQYLEELKDKKTMTIRDYLGNSLGVDYYFRIPRSYTRRAIFSIDEPSQTIRGVDRPIPPNYKKHPMDPVPIGSNVRALTPIERSYIQTFPKDFIFEGNKTNLNQMIGNAVPVKLAENVAKSIINYQKNMDI